MAPPDCEVSAGFVPAPQIPGELAWGGKLWSVAQHWKCLSEHSRVSTIVRTATGVVLQTNSISVSPRSMADSVSVSTVSNHASSSRRRVFGSLIQTTTGLAGASILR